MVDNEIKIKNDEAEVFDKKQIALAIRNATLGDEISCSLMEEGILNNCENCSLKNICSGIDKIKNDYIESTSTVIKEFNFE